MSDPSAARARARRTWRAAYGPIPPGHEIHHRDRNPFNNDLANLECLTVEAHKDEHREENRQRGKGNPSLAAAVKAATEWHRSPEGRAWHREHGKRTWAERRPQTRTCDHCATSYETLSKFGDERFCSNACKSAWRRASGIDDEDRHCGWCGKRFRVNKYAKTRFCGRSCAVRHRRAVPSDT